MRYLMQRYPWLAPLFAALGLTVVLAACGSSGSSVAANHPSAAAGVSSGAAAASQFANNPTVKADEQATLNAALACVEQTHGNPLTTNGRTEIGDCMAPKAVQADFRTCRTDALSGEHFGMAHPIQTFANSLTACYTVVVLHKPVPPGMALPASYHGAGSTAATPQSSSSTKATASPSAS